MVNVKPVHLGKNVRMSFSRINEVLEMPNLIEVQKNSYKWFLEEGLKEVFKDISAISDYQGNLVLDFIDYRLDEKPKYTIEECKERDATYAAPLRVRASLLNKETGEVKEQDIFMGDFPVMTPSGTFIINGAERVIVSQLVRSPGVYYSVSRDKAGKELFATTVIPNRGAWLEYETDSNDVFYVRIDKNRKLPVTTFIRALGLSSDAQILDFFGEDPRILATIEKDSTNNTEEALLEVYRKLRPGEPPTVDSAQSHLNALFFDARRYDLSRVGRYKYNKKLGIATRINGHVVAEPIINSRTGEVLAEPDEVLTREKAEEIERCGVDTVFLKAAGRTVKVISNGMVNLLDYIDCYTEDELEELDLNEKVRFSVLCEILDSCSDEDELKEMLKERADDLIPKHIIKDDIFATVNYICCLGNGVGNTDDIDHLGNRRIRSVGELLQNQFRIGFSRMERVIRERMTTQAQDMEVITPQALINIRPVVAAIKEFFGSSPLSQFMDQNNPLAELTHKRRLSALGPGGLSRDRAGFEVRDVHYSHYGRMCPVETPEGPNIGLISYLATFARINKYGFIEAPYRRVDKETGKVLDEVDYMTADREDEFVVAQANEPLTEENTFANKMVSVRHRDMVKIVEREHVDYMDVSPKMVVSVATAMIPFLENDDTNRALMGANMQRQAVPLLNPHSPYVGTGIEHRIARDSGSACRSVSNGIVTYVDANRVIVTEDSGEERVYELQKFRRSNAGTCINQRPIVKHGERVERGDILADGPSMQNGELALGQNVTIAFMTWHGYNYEDAIIMSERMVRDDVYTSIHIEEYDIECRETKLGPEEITRDIPNVSENACRHLDGRGIVMVGAEVKEGDILVGKVSPKGQSEVSPEEKLLLAIFGEKSREVRDTSLKVPHGGAGIVHSIRIFKRNEGHDLPPGVNEVVKVYIVQKRKISEGDKMAGRHGNKGVISKILPIEDMPYMPDGTPIDIMLNPFGVPSRMNIGQVLEIHLGMAAKKLGVKFATPVFDGISNDELKSIMAEAQTSPDGKLVLHDGKTGEPYDERISVGVMYMIKLAHMVDDKLHARATGPYSLVTQQPLGGKAQNGGQRFGEMEVWALEAYGAAHTLQEILTVKSDDIVGRTKTYEAIIKGKDMPESGIPESFRVLKHELQALAIDVKMLDEEGLEVDMKKMEADEINEVAALESVVSETMTDGGASQVIDKEDLPEEAAVVGFDDEDIE